MKISLVAAVAENGVIGRDGGMPWHIRDDVRFFMRVTAGRHVITGRKNFEAMGPLAGRHNIIVSRNAAYPARADDCSVVTSLEAALRLAEQHGETEAFVIGGAQIYALALPVAQTFYRTRVLAKVSGDVTFPSFDESAWTAETLSRHDADEHNEHPFVIEKLTRK